MAHQTDQQMELLRKQMELLAEQAKAIQRRREVSEWVYSAKMSFKPVINHVYHLYRRDDGAFCAFHAQSGGVDFIAKGCIGIRPFHPTFGRPHLGH